MDIVNLELGLAESAMETSAADEARVDRAYASLAAQLSTYWHGYFIESSEPIHIGGDFLHPFVLAPK